MFLLVLSFLIYAYKLHSLAVEGNSLFEYRCTDVNPSLISYKKAFLKIADIFNNPGNYEAGSGKTTLEDYISGMRVYLNKENRWLDMQKEFMDSWDFKLFEPWYIKKAADYQWKMYEGYRDDAKYMLEIYDAGGSTEEINTKLSEAKDRRNKNQILYYDFYGEAEKISDLRKIFGYVPIPRACNEGNMTIPNTSGSIDWDGDTKPTPTPDFINYDEIST